MSIFKPVNKSDLTSYESFVHKSYNLDSSSTGISFRNFESGSGLIDSNNYYKSLLVNYYLSGSSYSETQPRLNMPYFSFGPYSDKYPIHKTKFHSRKSGSLISIPQNYFGETIKPGTFELVDSSHQYTWNVTHESGTINNQISYPNNFRLSIKDDKYGNLYASNTYSSSLSVSSSVENYIGNVFYRNGVATITETGSLWYTHDGFDLSTVTFIQYKTLAEDILQVGFDFNYDGTKCWTLGSGFLTPKIYEYTLSTPWDISTITYTGNNLTVTSQDNVMMGIRFSSDGNYIFAVGQQNDDIYRYSCSTPWDITTCTHDQTCDTNLWPVDNGKLANPTGLSISPDGKHLMVHNGTARIEYYQMSTPFDITFTDSLNWVTYHQQDATDGEDTTAVGLYSSPDGRKVFAFGHLNDVVTEYTLKTPFNPNSYDSAHVDPWRGATGASLNIIQHRDMTSEMPSVISAGDITFSPSGHKMYIIDGTTTIIEYDMGGTHTTSASLEKLGTNYEVNFSGSKHIQTSEYSVQVNPNEFLSTNNPTAMEVSESQFTGYLAQNLTGSNNPWLPYFNGLGFYDEHGMCVAVAKWPQNIKRRDDIPMTIKVKIDF